ncbi:conserved protein, unknown function [Plasmodium berghei]|uniref:Cilia- and flagella-associated protein 299 n=2 Tax=Plasmodium berghei TaxID=5821 RepID=A0A509AHW7_PLABA|nr:conserved protein, unknown function [Plasmodium berghei ANKA]CXI36465.1 conserved protein, unknown function [Plasmodium berghei]SCM21593.1 conserved protein, unknown function [Plasmodium berghei]SCN24794.1 conserved protein, unknown function [Plasmodium berghei]SCO59921.1 conserved protein, unknown function [Plasmodium berghei]SCO61271.1 conserved protein, unknown function [Plasmodium berghei]|eukprot:XP_034421298.1 conserved protein, unknown function [Plasmodium berghei ANKA]
MENQLDNILSFNSYEEYIKTKITPTDLFYIEDEELIFELFSLGIKSRGILSYEDFHSTYKKGNKNEKKAIEEGNKESITYDINLLHSNVKDFFYMIDYHLHFCRKKKISTILFIRYLNKQKYEISSYIDINNTKIQEKINKKKYIYASKKDLSYYNWHNNYICTNDSENFKVVINKKIGFIFNHIDTNKYFILNSNKETIMKLNDNISKDVTKKININEKEHAIKLYQDVKSVELKVPNYLQCILYTIHL